MKERATPAAMRADMTEPRLKSIGINAGIGDLFVGSRGWRLTFRRHLRHLSPRPKGVRPGRNRPWTDMATASRPAGLIEATRGPRPPGLDGGEPMRALRRRRSRWPRARCRPRSWSDVVAGARAVDVFAGHAAAERVSRSRRRHSGSRPRSRPRRDHRWAARPRYRVAVSRGLRSTAQRACPLPK